MLDGAILDGTILTTDNGLNQTNGHPSTGDAAVLQTLDRSRDGGSTTHDDLSLHAASEVAAGLVRTSAFGEVVSAPPADAASAALLADRALRDRSTRFLNPARITGGITDGRTVSNLGNTSAANALSSQVSFEIHHWGVGIADLIPPTHAEPTVPASPEATEVLAPVVPNDVANPTAAVKPQPAPPVPEAPFFPEPLGSESTASDTAAPLDAAGSDNGMTSTPSGLEKPTTVPAEAISPDSSLSQAERFATPLPQPHESGTNIAPGQFSRSHSQANASEPTPALAQPWTPHNTWVIIHGWNSAPAIFEPTAEAITRARDGQDTVLLLDWREAAQNGNDGVGGLQSGGNFKAASWIASVADWAAQELKTWGISDTQAQTNLNLVGHSLGAFLSAEIADRFDGGVNSIFALDPASELNSVTGFGYDFDNDGETERPIRFDDVSRLSRSFVGARSTAGNQTVSGWAHESYEMDFGLSLLRPPGSEHRWVYEAFAQFVDDDNAIANQIGVKNLDLVSGWQKDGHRRRHEGRLIIDDRSREVERLVVESTEPGQDEIVYGTQRNDRLFGGWGRDQLLGGAGRDRLQGGQGNDVLVGGTGQDELWGGGGQDRFDFSAADVSTTIAAADIIHDFTVGGRFRSAETIGLGAGLTLAEIALETGMGEYAGDTLIRHGDQFLARLVGVGVSEVSIAKNFIQLP